MALIRCAECGGEVSTTATACPKCGATVPKPSKPKLWLWIPLGLVAVFFGFGALVGNSPQEQAKSRDRRAIELCWSDQGRKSLEPGAQRFAASVCELMEKEFVDKYRSKP